MNDKKEYSDKLRKEFFAKLKGKSRIGLSHGLLDGPYLDKFHLEGRHYTVREVLTDEEIRQIYMECGEPPFKPFIGYKKEGLENLATMLSVELDLMIEAGSNLAKENRIVYPKAKAT